MSSALIQYLSYDPDTGVFRWKISPGPGRPVGSVAGCRNRKGYVIIGLKGRVYSAHRVAWLLMNGAWPCQYIHHRNGSPDDNRWSNLREATPAQNCQNGRSKRGQWPRGVTRTKAGKFQAQIAASGKHYHLGSFDTPNEAHAAYVSAARRLHGEFARIA